MHKVNALGDEEEELQSVKEAEGEERWKRSHEMILSLLHPNLVHLVLSQGDSSFLVRELLL